MHLTFIHMNPEAQNLKPNVNDMEGPEPNVKEIRVVCRWCERVVQSFGLASYFPPWPMAG